VQVTMDEVVFKYLRSNGVHTLLISIERSNRALRETVQSFIIYYFVIKSHSKFNNDLLTGEF